MVRPVRSDGQSHSVTMASTISSIDSTWSSGSRSADEHLGSFAHDSGRGSTALTRTPVEATSMARAFVRRIRAALDAP